MFPTKAHQSWAQCPAFSHVAGIAKKLIPGTFCPKNAPDVFNAFDMPVDDVRVVILGKSPYPQKENACGYAFAIPDKQRHYNRWPASLKVLVDALIDHYKFEPSVIMNVHLEPDLKDWRDQGVLLLNAALTCLEGQPDSHEDLWRPFTTDLVKWLSDARPGLIWWFMGDDAKAFSHLVFDLAHHKLFSQHPARAARANLLMSDHQFGEVAKLYHSIYGQPLTWLIPF